MRIPIFAAALLAFVGCQQVASNPPTSDPTGGRPSLTPASIVPVAMTPRASATSGGAQLSFPPSILDPIIADAANRTGVAIANITVVTAEAVTWPDGGLGCPDPQVSYPQVPV
ncbi:MAG: hypothetical protein ABIP53_06455, partial [Candidatus Limnocylindrales bacterium]